MTIKPVYIVTDQDMCFSSDEDLAALEFKTERTALKEATHRLADSQGDDAEVWVWKLSHVLSKPDIEPVIERVK